MSSKTNTVPNPLRTLRRRTKRSQPNSRRRFHRRHFSAAVRDSDHPLKNGSDVSAKLEALQRLIPPQSAAAHGDPRQPEQLFEETADYIVLLKTQALILQNLLDFFGSRNAVVS